MGGGGIGGPKGAGQPQPSRPGGLTPGRSTLSLSSAPAMCGQGFAPTARALRSISGKHHVSLEEPRPGGKPCFRPWARGRQTDRLRGPRTYLPWPEEEGGAVLKTVLVAGSPAQCWGGPPQAAQPDSSRSRDEQVLTKSTLGTY